LHLGRGLAGNTNQSSISGLNAHTGTDVEEEKGHNDTETEEGRIESQHSGASEAVLNRDEISERDIE
jgi:hypothetical protein